MEEMTAGVDVLTFTRSGRLHAVPTSHVGEVVQVHSELERIGPVAVHRLRGALVPVADVGAADENPGRVAAGAVLVVLAAAGRHVALVTDGVTTTGTATGRASHLGVVDVAGESVVFVDPDVLLAARGTAAPEPVTQEVTERAGVDAVLVDVGAQRVAIPVGDVGRLGVLAAADLERVGRRAVTQRGGRIMPVLRLADILEMDEPAELSGPTLEVGAGAAHAALTVTAHVGLTQVDPSAGVQVVGDRVTSVVLDLPARVARFLGRAA